jgi:DNA repair protein RadA/Sms
MASNPSGKVKTHYVCQSCGHVSAKWLGRCPGCEAWNTLVEERIQPLVADSSLAAVRSEFRGMGKSRGAQKQLDDAEEAAFFAKESKALVREGRGGVAMDTYAHGPSISSGQGPDWVPLESNEDETNAATRANLSGKDTHRRISTGLGELDRVLGGGLLPDSFILLGGDPGIGKSTLLLQMARGVISSSQDVRILYVSGEESIEQIRGRARRLGIESRGRIFLAAETQLERVFATVKELEPNVIVMDSLQTFSSGYLQAAPGSVSQVREVAARLMALAKSAGIAVWLVGHVTKEGSIAGPKVVEHMVDTVLYFEGDGGHTYRLLRTVKNRFGSTRELGVFEMEGEGLAEVSNPSSLFLSERKEAVSGTAITSSMEGSRPLLIELQALVAPSGLAVPRRTSVGMDSSRISLIAAILERHMRVKLAQNDLFFNVAGGLKLSEPACDLAAAAAIWSSVEERALPPDWVWMGELGLTGEVRRIGQIDSRLTEAGKLGFTTAVIPEATPRALLERWKTANKDGVRLKTVARVSDIGKVLERG